MKKLTLALALVLCLVLAFASCGNKKTDSTTAQQATEPAATTAAQATDPSTEPEATQPEATQPEATQPEATQPEATQPGHVHVPEADYWIDWPATCNAPGQKSLYCEECGEQIPESITEIPIDPNAHNVASWTVTEAVNMFHTTGSRNGVCTICNETIVEDLQFAPTIETFDMTSGQYNADKVYFEDVRGGKHFYPTESDPIGNDLFVEFSILWNESILNFDSSADSYMCGRFNQGKPLYYFSPVAGCPTSDANVAGAFEWMGNFKTTISDDEVTTPATMMAPSSNYADYPNINGTDPDHPEYGWHRIGIRYHFELLDGKSGADLKDYRGTVTVYLDGTAIYKLSTGDLGMQIKDSHLFNAERVGDTVTYSDVDSWIIPFQINRARTKTDTTAYIALADLSVTCGKSFVMPVEKVASPAAATLTVAEGVEIPAPIYFQPASN